MKNPNKTRNGLPLPDLKRFNKISQDFLYRENQRAKIFARWELDFLWTRFRDMTLPELENLDETLLTASELIIVKQIKYMAKTGDMSELNRLYDRVIGKPKEIKEEKEINEVEFSIDILNPTKEKTIEINSQPIS